MARYDQVGDIIRGLIGRNAGGVPLDVSDDVARAAMLHWATPHWLLHDAHEAYIGDIATPVAGALAALVVAHLGPALLDRQEALAMQFDGHATSACRLDGDRSRPGTSIGSESSRHPKRSARAGMSCSIAGR